MDISQIHEHLNLCTEQITLAELYREERERAGKAKRDLDIILASRYLSKFRAEKRNLGYEMALLMLIEADAEALGIYRDYMTSESNYRALEKLLDAYQSKISFLQSIMKYILKGE